MKIFRSGFALCALALLSCLLLSSCSVFDFFSVDSLIRPPRLTGENALIEQAFEAAAGRDILLLSPVAGMYRSSFIQFDLDQDGEDETVVFYSKNDSPNEAHMHFLKYDGYRWYSIGDVTGNGSEIYSVEFYDLDKAKGYEIAVSWTVSDSKRNKTLGLYRFVGNDGFPDITQLSVFQIFDYMVSDFDFDGQPELLYLMNYTSDKKQLFKASMVKMGIDDAAIHFVCEFQLQPSVSLPLNMDFDIRNGLYRLYIDCVNTDGSYYTEILYYDLSAAILSRVLNEEGRALSELTVRSLEVYSQDINNDQLIEVPVEIRHEDFTYLAQNQETRGDLPLIRFYRCRGSSLQPMKFTYFYAPDVSYRYRLDPLLGKYTCSFVPTENQLQFFAEAHPESPVFAVSYVSFPHGISDIRIDITEPDASYYTKTYLEELAEIL